MKNIINILKIRISKICKWTNRLKKTIGRFIGRVLCKEFNSFIILFSAINYDGKKVAGVGPFNANIGVDLLLKYGLYANVIYSHKDAFPITSDGLNNTSSYSLLNAKIGFQRSLSPHFDLNVYFGIDNIGGTQYPIFVFINQLPDAYLPGPLNATYYGGLNLKYNF